MSDIHNNRAPFYRKFMIFLFYRRGSFISGTRSPVRRRAMLRQAISALLSRENTVRALRPSAMGMPSSSGITPSSGRPAASMASSMLLLSALSSCAARG